MTDVIDAQKPDATPTPPIFVVAVFTSAALVFMVQPMVAKLVLPLLGGSPAVWNTSMAFFQIALLAGYGYAHLLQKLPSVRRQIAVHVAALAIAGLTIFPLRISTLMGDPSSVQPGLWLFGLLTLSIGLPFAILSATAPLVQAWHARVMRGEGAAEPWSLYAASNPGQPAGPAGLSGHCRAAADPAGAALDLDRGLSGLRADPRLAGGAGVETGAGAGRAWSRPPPRPRRITDCP